MSKYLNMTDEEMLNAAPPTDEELQAMNEQDAPEDRTDEVEAATPAETSEATAAEVTDESLADATEQVSDDANDDSVEKNGAETKTPEAAAEEKETKPEAVAEQEQKEQTAVDYEAEYKRLLAPFKANGKEVEIKSVEDAITLMQMGANYNKKMAALKPNLRILKLLENNSLLDQEKLSFLIDLERKNPEAISKLVKDSGLDPMDIAADKAGEYSPKIHTVDEREFALDTVLDEIQASPSYNRTLSIVSSEWDGASKQLISDTPQLIKVINDHVERGIYDIINTEVEREKMLGRLTGLSDLEAYRKVGDAIQARGGFNHLSDQQEKTSEKVVVQPKPKAADDEKLKEKKRAASSSKPGVAKTVEEDFNPLNLSDEDFIKLAAERFK